MLALGVAALRTLPSVANVHACRRMPPSPIGLSMLLIGPGDAAVGDMEIWQVTEFMCV